MGFFSSNRTKSSGKEATLVIVGFDPSIQRVRDLERLHKFDEAKKLFEPLIRSTAQALKHEAQGFGVLLRALDEAEARGSAALCDELRDALRANPRAYTEQGRQVLANRLASNSDCEVVYVCQHCGGFIHHVTVACTDCGYSVSNLEQLRRAMFLSSNYLTASSLAFLGARIRNGLEFDQLYPGLVEQFVKVAEEQLTAKLLQPLLDYSLKPDRRTKPVILGSATCECGTKTAVHLWSMKCSSCGSADLNLPSAGEYKLMLRDGLLWFQLVPELAPVENRIKPIFVLMSKLKESATHAGTQATQADGARLKHLLEQVGVLHDKAGTYAITFSVLGVQGEAVVPAFDPTSVSGRMTVAGPTLFNRLIELCFQGRSFR